MWRGCVIPAAVSLAAVDVRRLAREERADLAASLSPRQWQAPTLCARWRVRDVVAHVVSYDELDVRGLLAHAVRGQFRPSRVNAVAGQVPHLQPGAFGDFRRGARAVGGGLGQPGAMTGMSIM